MLTNFENLYKNKDKINNDEWASQISDNFLTGEPLPSMDVQYDYYKQILPLITLDEVTARLKGLISDDNSFIVVEGPDDKKHLTEAEAFDILKKVRAENISPYNDITGGPELISEILEGSPVVKTLPLPRFGASEWTLANGARVVFKHAEYEKDNVSLFGYAFGGSSVYADSLVPSLSLFPEIISMYGAGAFDNVALTKMLAGKKASVSLGIQETMQTISGSSTPRDFETMMQLLFLRFARPNYNREAYDAIMGRFIAVINAMQKNPNKILSDSLSLNITGYSPRTFIMTPESMKKITYDDVNYIYRTAFDDASSFTFFITGNIDEETARTMAEKYIGSLPSLHLNETWKDNGVRQPAGIVRKEIPLPLAVPKATIVINYTSAIKFNPENNLSLDVLKGILDLIYTEKVREDKSGTYGVSTDATSYKRPVEKADLLIAFECAPERSAELMEIIYRELQNIAVSGPTQVNLDKSVSNLLKTREEEKQHNKYWANTIRNYYVYGFDDNADSNFSDILNKTTIKDIKKLVRKYLAKADLLEMVFVPEKKEPEK
jgi:zinc protease